RVSLQYRKQFHALVGAGGDDYLAHRLVADAVDDDRAGGGQLLPVPQQTKHASLEFTQILHARDDFLAGVTPLAEADGPQMLKIEHLRDEALAGGALYLADTKPDQLQAPGAGRHRRGVLGQT